MELLKKDLVIKFTMKNIRIKILLVLMIVLSLFMGISINGNWGFLYQFEFFDFLQLHEKGFKDYVLWGIIILSHIGIICLPFMVEKNYFRRILVYFPLIYWLGYLFLEAGYFILLIPFAAVWIVLLLYFKKNKSTVKNS